MSEPAAWAALRDDGSVAWTAESAKAAADVDTDLRRRIVPLYRSPTLTDAERGALRAAIEWLTTLSSRRREIHSADLLMEDARTLRGLWQRTL